MVINTTFNNTSDISQGQIQGGRPRSAPHLKLETYDFLA
jgi:hypothetical protein